MPLEAGLLDILACPACHAPLRESTAPRTTDDAADGEADTAELVCTADDCGLAYPIRDEIPVLLIDEARHPA
jgi:uncharacterized protein YbaR (Trm112 family)